MKRHGLRALGLAFMATLALMAFGAAAAQATLILRHTAILLNATEKEAGKVLEAGKAKTATGALEGTAILKVPSKSLELRCQEGAVSEVSIENESDTKKNPEGKELLSASESGLAAMGKGKVEFSKCGVFIAGVESAACTKAFNEHNKNAKGEGGHPSAKFLALTLLHFKEVGNLTTHFLLVRITPLSGPAEPFTVLEFGGTCSMPEKLIIGGSLAGEVSFPMPYIDGKTVSIKFESESAFGKELNTNAEAKMLQGANEAFITSKDSAEIVGVEKWGVM